MNGKRRVVVTPAGGDEPHPYRSHPVAEIKDDGQEFLDRYGDWN